jgi:hypothetical protein
VQALRAGFKARQIGEKALDFAQIPGTQDMALALTNVAYKNGNDQQAKATYSAADIESLRSETLPVISIRRK